MPATVVTPNAPRREAARSYVDDVVVVVPPPGGGPWRRRAPREAYSAATILSTEVVGWVLELGVR